ncbi:hypothetical protein [Paenibacillus sp. 79R4]|uniref:hypothetical protein n=1 Tax=Paenibacillus sp. 79R4 TaxID=2212847 RepID=UPI00211751B9|nr:hypothetical protein [Paenibacillus sp. 79R4]
MNTQEKAARVEQLRQQMNQENAAYFQEMCNYVRKEEEISDAKKEELLLYLAQKISKHEPKGVNADQLFGANAAAYCAQLIDDVQMRRPRTLREKIKYYIMIPWVTITWVFFIFMITSFFGKWFGGEFANTTINSGILVLIAGLAIVFIESITRFLGPGQEEDDAKQAAPSPDPRQSRKFFDMKAFGIYIIIALAVVAAGLLLNRIMPSFVVTPWQSLIIFIIGLLGQIFIFARRSK